MELRGPTSEQLDRRRKRAKRRGNGVKLFRTAGLYQLRISSTLARWTVRIEQLTPEEAELYTPKSQD